MQPDANMPINDIEQESMIVAGAPRLSTANDTSMMMTFVNNIPQAISTPFKEGVPSLNSVSGDANNTKDVFEALKMQKASGSSASNSGYNRLDLTNDVFNKIGRAERNVDNESTTFNVIEPKKSLSNTCHWSPAHTRYSPVAQEKMKNLMELMEKSRKENSTFQDEVTYTISPTRQQATKGFMDDSMLTPTRSFSRHKLADSMNTKKLGRISLDQLGASFDTEANLSAMLAVATKQRPNMSLCALMVEEDESEVEMNEWQAKMRLIEDEIDACLKESKAEHQANALTTEVLNKWSTSDKEEKEFDEKMIIEYEAIKSRLHSPLPTGSEFQVRFELPTSVPFVEIDLVDKTVCKGDNIQLECRITCDHSSRHTWKGPNGVVLFTDNSIEQTQDQDGIFLLSIRNVTPAHAGNYTLIIENDHGKCSTSANVCVLTEPDAPTDVRCSWSDVPILQNGRDRSNGSLKLKWRTPLKGGAQTLWYVVEHRREDWPANQFREVIKGIEHCAIRISHLLPSMVYMFRVYAYNKAFRSVPSQVIRAIPAEEEQKFHMRESALAAKLRAYVQSNGIDLLSEPITKLFVVDHLIGKGRFSRVYRATCRISALHMAVKLLNNGHSYPTNSSNRFGHDYLSEIAEAAVREVTALKAVAGHPNFVSYFKAAIFSGQLAIITHKVNGPQILTFLCQLGFVSEAIIQTLCRDLFGALQYLHERGFAHLAIKPEDLLVECHQQMPKLVVIDLGTCQSLQAMSGLSVWQGGPLEFTSPEQLGHKPCQKSDIWSVGVLLFVLCNGFSPFEDDNEEMVRLNILNARIAALPAADENKGIHRFSPALLALLEHIFVTDVRERPSAGQCLADTWLDKPPSGELIMVDYLQDYIERRRNRMRTSFLLHEL